MNINLHFSGINAQEYILLLGCIGSHMISLIRNCQTVFQNICTILHSHQFMSNPVSTYPYQHLILLLLYFSITIGVCCLNVVLICIFLIANDERAFHELVCHLCTSVNCLFTSFACFLIGFVFPLLRFSFYGYCFWCQV